MSIADLRREYNLTGLRRADLEADPISQFKKWFNQASGLRAGGRVRKFFIRLYKIVHLIPASEPMDINAMTLATVNKQGQPSARVVLLKGLDPRGFIFFTNYDSRKGCELAENPQASLVFYWSDLERQVCICGRAEKLTRQESEAYFKTRPRGSRIAAWASRQSSVVADRAALEAGYQRLDALYLGQEVPMPPNWGGYLVIPQRVEFWQGRPNRLHDRFAYTRQPNDAWQIERLSP
jgi:pyridoxamine 5'-phosphate oxidase